MSAAAEPRSPSPTIIESITVRGQQYSSAPPLRSPSNSLPITDENQHNSTGSLAQHIRRAYDTKGLRASSRDPNVQPSSSSSHVKLFNSPKPKERGGSFQRSLPPPSPEVRVQDTDALLHSPAAAPVCDDLNRSSSSNATCRPRPSHPAGTDLDVQQQLSVQVIEQASGILAKYEDVVRQTEEQSLIRLSERIAQIDEEWAKRTELFVAYKAAFEHDLSSKLEMMQQTRQKDLQQLAEDLQEDARRQLQAKCDAQASLEEQVLRQAEAFKEEYKKVLEADFYERVALMDQRIAEREKKWVRILQEERSRVVAIEKESHAQQEKIHLQAVSDAMKEISALREQLLREHEEQRVGLLREVVASRSEVTAEHEEALRKANDRVRDIQQRCATAILRAQKEVETIQIELAGKNTQLADRQLQEDQLVLQQLTSKCAAVRQEVDAQWQKAFDEQKKTHEHMMEAMRQEHHDEVNALRAEQRRRETDVEMSCEQRIAEAEKSANKRVEERLAEAAKTVEQRDDIIKQMKESHADLSNRVLTLTQELEQQSAAFDVRSCSLQHEVEETWRARLLETRSHYDERLEKMVAKLHASVAANEHEDVKKQLRMKDKQILELKSSLATTTREAVREADTVWKERLDEMEQRLRARETEAAEEISMMRAQARLGMNALEQSWQERLAAENDKWAAHLQAQIQWEAQRCQAAVDVAQRSADHRVEAAMRSMEEGWKQRAHEFEARIADANKALIAREDALRVREAQLHDEVLSNIATTLDHERTLLSEEGARQRLAMLQQRQELDKQEVTLRQEFEVTYDARLQVAKEHLKYHSSEWMQQLLEFVEAREAHWIDVRREETEAMKALFHEELNRTRYHHQEMLQMAQDNAQAVVRREAAVLSEREAAMEQHWVEMSSAAEEAAVKRTQQIMEALSELREQALEADQEQSNARWASLQADILSRTADIEQDRRKFEEDIRQRYEALLQAERARAASAIDAAARAQNDHLEEMRSQQREEEESRRVAMYAAHEEARERWESRLQETVDAYEQRLKDRSEKTAELLRQKDVVMEQTRQRLLSQAETQRRELEETMQLQLEEVRASCTQRLQESAERESALRQQFAKDVDDVEVAHARERDALMQELHESYKEAIASLHAEVHAREQLQIEQEQEHAKQFESEVFRMVRDVQEKYSQFTLAQAQRATDEKAKQVEQLSLLQQEQEAAQRTLQGQVDALVKERVEAMEAQLEEESSKRQEHFADRLVELRALLQHERERNSTLQSRLEELEARHATDKAVLDHQRLLTHRELHAKFQSLLGVSDVVPAASSLTPPRTSPAAAVATIPSTPVVSHVGQPTGEAQPWVYTPFVATSYRTPQRSTAAQSVAVACVSLPSPCALSPSPGSEPNLQPLWQRLRDLWHVLEVPVAEQRAVEADVAAIVSVSVQKSRLEDVVRKLEAQLPILESYTRRAYLKQVIRDSTETEHTQMAQREVDGLLEELKSSITLYERTHKQIFMFRGERLIDKLLDEQCGPSTS